MFRENIAITEQNINVWDEPGVDFKDGPLLYEYLKKVETVVTKFGCEFIAHAVQGFCVIVLITYSPKSYFLWQCCLRR